MMFKLLSDQDWGGFHWNRTERFLYSAITTVSSCERRKGKDFCPWGTWALHCLLSPPAPPQDSTRCHTRPTPHSASVLCFSTAKFSLFETRKQMNSCLKPTNKQKNNLQNQHEVDKELLFLKELVFHQLCLCAALYNSNSEQCQKMAGMSLGQHMQDRTIFINKTFPVISLARLEQRCPGTR